MGAGGASGGSGTGPLGVEEEAETEKKTLLGS